MNIVHTESSLGWGGQEIRILSESQGLIARGHRVGLVCPPEARVHEEARRRGVPVTALPIGRKNLRGFLALRRWLRENPCDVVNTHSSTDSWLSALALKSLGRPCPLVRTRHISAAVPTGAATQATLEPDIAPKAEADAIVATASEPRMRPTMVMMRSMMRLAIPPRAMISPA